MTKHLTVTFHSANGLETTDDSQAMLVYAELISGQARQVMTHVDLVGGANPTWDRTVKLPLASVDPGNGYLTVELKDARVNKIVGVVNIDIKELLAKGEGNTPKVVTFPVTTASGHCQGTLTLSFKFDSAKKKLKNFLRGTASRLLPCLLMTAGKEAAEAAGFGGDEDEDPML